MLAFSLVLALSLGGMATAQTAPPPPSAPAVASPAPLAPPAMPKPDWSKMRAMMKQMQTAMKRMRDLRRTERASMLGALSKAHRAALASVVGALAIAAKPDPKAAAAKINAMLTLKERAAIFAALRTYMTKLTAAHKAMFQSISKSMPSPAPAITVDTSDMRLAAPMARMHRGRHRRMVTAGTLLLAQTGFGPMGSMRMPRDPMGIRIRMRMRGPMGPMRRMPMGPGPAMPPPAATASPSP